MTKRKVGGYAWKNAVGDSHRALDTIQRYMEKIVDIANKPPVSQRLLLTYIIHASLAVNNANQALRELERFGNGQDGSEQ